MLKDPNMDYSFHKIESFRLAALPYHFQEEAIKWLESEGVYSEFIYTEKDVFHLSVIIHCVNCFYKVPKEIQPFFAELIRNEIFSLSGFIKADTEPLTAIHAIDDAKFFSDFYYHFT